MRFFVYILRSLKTRAYYVGQTDDLENRLRAHNRGEVKSTRWGRPWEIVYQESFATRGEAMRREREIKSHKSRAYVEKLIRSSAERSAAGEASPLGPVAHLCRRHPFPEGTTSWRDLGCKVTTMYFVYILLSLSTGKWYIGQTEDVEKRVRRHNQGECRSTKSGRPWILVHQEESKTRSEAVLRERFLKSPAGWSELQAIKKRYTSERSAAR